MCVYVLCFFCVMYSGEQLIWNALFDNYIIKSTLKYHLNTKIKVSVNFMLKKLSGGGF